MEKWREVWRKGFLPSLSTAGLESLKEALEKDDPRLIQGLTAKGSRNEDGTVAFALAACAVAYCAWEADPHERLNDIESFFIETCEACDERMGIDDACDDFLDWFDETPREEMRRLLLEEVTLNLSERKQS